MKRIATIIALVLCGGVFAAVETVEIADGGTWTASAGRLASVRVLSTAASGAFTLKGVESWDVSSNVTTTVTAETPVWRRVLTNETQAVTNDYPGQVVFTPPPPWKIAGEGWITNTVTTMAGKEKIGRSCLSAWASARRCC